MTSSPPAPDAGIARRMVRLLGERNDDAIPPVPI